MNTSKQIAGGAIISYGSIIFSVITGLLYTPWMIECIGAEQYALYVLAISVVNFFLLDFGIGTGVTKFLSSYYAKGKTEESKQFLGIVLKVFSLISIFIALCLTVFYFFINQIYRGLTTDEINILKQLFIIVSFYSVVLFPCMSFNGILMANEEFVALKACNLAQQICTVLCIVLFLLNDSGVYTLVIVNAVCGVVFSFIKYIIIKRKLKQSFCLKYWNKEIAKKLFGYSIWMTIITISQRCIFNIMPSIIAALIGTLEVAIFSLAALLESYVFTFADAINGMFMPRITKILDSNDSNEKISELMCNVGKYHIYTIGLIYIGFILVGKEFVELWLGTGFENVYICTLILLFPSLIHIPQQVAKTMLLVTDVVKEQGIIYVVMAVANVGFSLLLIPLFGIVGAAVSVLCAYMIRTIGLNYLYKSRLDIKLSNYFKEVYFKWLIIALVSLAICYILIKTIPCLGWISLLIKVLIICCVYINIFIIFERRVAKKLKIKIKELFFNKI